METTRRILLLEDDAGDADLVCEMLSDQKGRVFKIDCAANLHEALHRLQSGTYDIILADLSLPDSTGLDTFFRLRERSDDPPILVLTGLDDEQVALKALRQGAQDYFVKGQFTGALLAKAIDYAIERNRIRRELSMTTAQLSEANQRLSQMAHNDSLTNLLNRRGLERVLTRELAWAHRKRSATVALIIDLDDFKRINDTWGHVAGDAVLTEISQRMQEPLRTTDFAARVGGDEFVILLPDTELNEGLKIAEKVRASIGEDDFTVSSQSIQVTVSIGAIPVSGASVSIDDLLAESHDVLYQSKREGKNRVSYEEKRRDTQRPDRSQDELDIFRAHNKFRVLMQPIYDLRNERVVGTEFFSRASLPAWEKPEDFFRMSRDPHFVMETDVECLKTCLKAAKSLPTDIRRHFNITPTTVAESSSLEVLETILGNEENGGNFCLEISQGQVLGEPLSMIKALDSLKKRGYRIALDHASFSQNTLESLILMKPDFIKLDKQFAGLRGDKAKFRSIKRLLTVAESLNTVVIAAAVESRDDLETLKTLEIKYGQGHLWGQPQPVGASNAFIEGPSAN